MYTADNPIKFSRSMPSARLLRTWGYLVSLPMEEKFVFGDKSHPLTFTQTLKKIMIGATDTLEYK